MKSIVTAVFLFGTFIVAVAQEPSKVKGDEKRPISTKPVKIDKATAVKTNSTPQRKPAKFKPIRKVAAKLKAKEDIQNK